MEIEKTIFEDSFIIKPKHFKDNRGFFFESYQKEKYAKLGITDDFVQDNVSYSFKNVLRGLHYQYPCEQAKLVYVLSGEILDVAVDIRKNSPTFKKHEKQILSFENKKQFYIPKGFLHGFYVLSDFAIVSYKCSSFYNPEDEIGVLYSDPDLAIDWKIKGEVIISDKDAKNLSFNKISNYLPML